MGIKLIKPVIKFPIVLIVVVLFLIAAFFDLLSFIVDYSIKYCFDITDPYIKKFTSLPP